MSYSSRRRAPSNYGKPNQAALDRELARHNRHNPKPKETKKMDLTQIISEYGTPKPELISERDNGKGTMLSYVGHADVTKMLIEIDPLWDWQPAAWIDGRPAIHRHHAKMVFRNGDVKETEVATMWGFLTVLGKTLPCVGSAPADKEDVEKELIGDLIRNGAMRFGICLNLWAKSNDYKPGQIQRTTTQQGDVTVNAPANAPSEKQLWLYKKLLKEAGQLPPANIAGMDKYEVSKAIEALKNGGPDELPPLPEEEPF